MKAAPAELFACWAPATIVLPASATDHPRKSPECAPSVSVAVGVFVPAQPVIGRSNTSTAPVCWPESPKLGAPAATVLPLAETETDLPILLPRASGALSLSAAADATVVLAHPP